MRKRRLFIEKIALIFISIIVLVVLVFTAGLVDPAVQFADPGLEAAVRDKLEKPEKPIHKSDLLTITELDASGRDIRDLQGIEYLRQLVNLNLEDNVVEDLVPLGSLYKLTELNLRNNEIADLEEVNFEAITGLPLRKLSLRYNVARPVPGEQIRLSDIDLLQRLTQLEELELRYNHIEDITPLSNLTNLKVLNLRENLITDISPLKNLTALQELNLRENDLSCIAPLVNLEGLLYLNIHSNENIETIEPISGLINLQTLIMRNVPVGEQVTALRNLTNLQRLNIRNCSISDTAVIGDLMAEGALQDDPEAKEVATLNIRDNNLIFKDIDTYDPIREYWFNITHRQPFSLPRAYSSISPPQFSQPGGFYDEDFLLELSVEDPDAVIYYTLDGSDPCPHNTDGTVYYYKNKYPTNPGDSFGSFIENKFVTMIYNEPIYINESKNDGFSISYINTTSDSYAFQPEGRFDYGTIIRAVVYKEGYLPSAIITKSYFVGDDPNRRYHIPVISIATFEPNLFDYEFGIYTAGKRFDDWRKDNPLEEYISWIVPANFHQRGMEWERRANIEIFNPDGKLLINQVCGIRTHGGTSRRAPNKGLRLYSRIEYGESFFDIQLFQDKNIDQFKSFVIRSSGDDYYYTMFRDALLQSLVKDLSIDYQAYQPAILFINGVYWGIYNIRDRIDRYYLYYEHGVDPGKIDLLTGNASIKEGSNEHYLELLKYIKANNLIEGSAYDHIDTLLDINNFINYTTSQIYFNNTDWPGSNIDFWRMQTDKYDPDAPSGHDGRWRWILYDTDFGFGLYDGAEGYKHNTLAFATEAGGDSWPNPDWSTFLLRTLLENPLFTVAFINRIADHLNTIFLPEVVIDQINEMQDNLAPLMQEHIDRWGQPSSIENWEENVEVMRVFAQNRPEYLRKQIVEYFGLSGTASVRLITDFSKGTIVVNTIDIKPFLLDEDSAGDWYGIYFHDIPITITAAPEPGYIFARWKEIDKNDKSLILTLTEDITLTAIFVEQ